jgi:hypothetical protein
MEFTLVCPIHNEDSSLPITLGGMYAVKPTEIIFTLDRCTDKSEKIIEKVAKNYETDTRIIIKTSDDGKDWMFRSAYLRRDAYQRAKYDTILNTSADLALTTEINRYLPQVGIKYGLISFGYIERWNIYFFIGRLKNIFTPNKGFAGLLAFSKKAWLETENIEDLKKIPRGEDTHLKLAISSKYKIAHRLTHCLHLRPRTTFWNQYNQGVDFWNQLHIPPYKMFLHSLFFVKPAAFTGYLHARNDKKNK